MSKYIISITHILGGRAVKANVAIEEESLYEILPYIKGVLQAIGFVINGDLVIEENDEQNRDRELDSENEVGKKEHRKK